MTSKRFLNKLLCFMFAIILLYTMKERERRLFLKLGVISVNGGGGFNCCCYPTSSEGWEHWWKTREPQNSGNSPGPGLEVVKRQSR